MTSPAAAPTWCPRRTRQPPPAGDRRRSATAARCSAAPTKGRTDEYEPPETIVAPRRRGGTATDRTGHPNRDPTGTPPGGSRDDDGVVYEPGQPVRWKQPGGSRWRYGHLGDNPVEPDGALRIYEEHNGAARTLRPSQVQRMVRGPRGGQHWQLCETAPTVPPSPLERLQQAADKIRGAATEGLSL